MYACSYRRVGKSADIRYNRCCTGSLIGLITYHAPFPWVFDTLSQRTTVSTNIFVPISLFSSSSHRLGSLLSTLLLLLVCSHRCLILFPKTTVSNSLSQRTTVNINIFVPISLFSSFLIGWVVCSVHSCSYWYALIGVWFSFPKQLYLILSPKEQLWTSIYLYQYLFSQAFSLAG